MNSKNAAFENSLQCLRHPLTVLAIAVLVLNDHVFKALTPSWLTGKLSDFAGLFFFPFVLAAGLSLVLTRIRFSNLQIGAMALGITGVWFFLLKTNVFINLLSTQSASAIFGMPVSYALDASDVLALVMLLPAWLLWIQPKIFVAKKRSWVFLVAGLLASLATSPAVPSVNPDKLLYQNDVLYVIDLSNNSYESSDDLGLSWGRSYDLPAANLKKPYAAQACDPENARVCYRTPGNGTVEMTSDGGSSWQVVWDLGIPVGRAGVVERIRGENIPLGPYDLLTIRKDNQTILFVALGNIGLLRHRQVADDWVLAHRQFQFWRSDFLAPYSEPNFAKANAMLGTDWFRWETVSMLTLLAALGWLRRKYADIVSQQENISISFFFLLAALCVYTIMAGFVMMIISILFFSSRISDYLPTIQVVIVYFIPLIGMLAYMNRLVVDIIEKPADVLKTLFISAISALGVLLFGIFPIIFWVQGIIEQNIHVVLWNILPIVCIIYGWFYFLSHQTYRDPSLE